MAAVGLAFKTSIAPFHQWTPDVYQGAPTPITGFMAVATKAAAFARLHPLLRRRPRRRRPTTGSRRSRCSPRSRSSSATSAPSARTRCKRLLGYSGVAQAGYMLGGVVVATEAGVSALVFYLAAYALDEPGGLRASSSPASARRRYGDDIARGARASARERPLLAWPLTISMLALAGPAGDRGLHRQALPDRGAGRGRLHLARASSIAIGTMISLAYYLRVVAAMWMRPGERPPRARPRRSPAPRPRPTRSTPRPGAASTSSCPPCSPAAGGRLLRRHPAAAGRVRRYGVAPPSSSAPRLTRAVRLRAWMGVLLTTVAIVVAVSVGVVAGARGRRRQGQPRAAALTALTRSTC